MKNNLENLFKKTASGIKPGLEITEELLKKVLDPHKKFRAIHIAGTNGKGSTASYLESIFRKSGLKTGLYTSPHLFDFKERIRVDNQKITEDELVRLFNLVEKQDNGERKATFFEFTTVMAFLHFMEKEVDIAIIETGMGGRFDSTNLIKPVLSIITNIDIEHTEFLGDSIEKIAYEKAGIIKENTPVITGASDKALEVIKDIAADNKSDLFVLNRDFKYFKEKGRYFYKGISGEKMILSPSLQGSHQLKNASLAMAACEVLSIKTQSITEFKKDIIEKAISETLWPGRLEKISSSPEIIVDCAHNNHAAKTLAEYIESKNKKATIVFGCLGDKNFRAILKTLEPAAKKFVFTKPDSERAIEPSVLSQLTEVENSVIENPMEALLYAKKAARENSLICVAGSIYLAGPILKQFNKI